MSLLNAFILLIAIIYTFDFIVAIVCSHFPNLNIKYTFNGKSHFIGASAVIYILWYYQYITTLVG